MPSKTSSAAIFFGILAGAFAQTPPTLTLQQAEAMAIQNHPQVLGAQNEINFANQQIVENRSAYYPILNADVTGAQGNINGRIGAGYLADSRLFNHQGDGIDVSQLVTDSGRTPNLVASARLQAKATAQTYQATRYDVLIGVNRAYYNVLRAQNLVKVANETVAARQTLSDQITELANSNLRSQLDASFAQVQVSQAKLLLIQAQNGVQDAQADLARALGSDQSIANYQLMDEPLPSGPPAKADDLVTQAVNNRPELASLRFSRDSAYKFAAAEKDLSRPTVTVDAVAGYQPYIDNVTKTPIPSEYEGVVANLSVPIFNGHLFSARREAADQHAMEADQTLRNEQERITRDVRVAWAGAVNAFDRIDVTAQFLREAALAINLAQGRYDLNLASIVELTTAQLGLTQAEIENVNAKYDYQISNAVLQYSMGLLR
jgi:outer membrane protein